MDKFILAFALIGWCGAVAVMLGAYYDSSIFWQIGLFVYGMLIGHLTVKAVMNKRGR